MVWESGHMLPFSLTQTSPKSPMVGSKRLRNVVDRKTRRDSVLKDWCHLGCDVS